MNQKQNTSLSFIILMNLIPIAGVIFWSWTPFSVFYFFWLETLIIAVFNALKIVLCRGDEYDQKIEQSHKILGQVHSSPVSHVGKAFRYLMMRIFIFFFYLLFIVVFIGFMHTNKEDSLANMQIGLFMNKSFNYAILGFVLSQALQFIFDFILNDEYKHTHTSDFASIFDGRQIIIHVAVVIGGVFGGFMEKTGTENHFQLVSVFVMSVFCVVKTIYEIIKYTGKQNIFANRKGVGF